MRNFFGIEEPCGSTGAGVTTRLVDEVTCCLITELNAQLVECALDCVPDTSQDIGLDGGSEVSKVFFSSFSTRHAAYCHGSIHIALHTWAALVDFLHQGVELLLTDESAETVVTNGFVRQHKIQLLLSRYAVTEHDNGIAIE